MQTSDLRDIREGMKVFDSRDHEIGTVERVQFGADNPATPGLEANSIEGMEPPRDRSIVDNVLDVFREDDLPKEIHDRLLMQGFVRLDADGLFASDRYILPDQIRSVLGDKITLTVEKSELMKRH